MTESALLQKIRIDEHSGCSVFEEAAEELYRCLLVEEATPAFWAKLGLARVQWDEDGGTGQAEAILRVLSITDSEVALGAIDSQFHGGYAFYDAPLETALWLQLELYDPRHLPSSAGAAHVLPLPFSAAAPLHGHVLVTAGVQDPLTVRGV